MVRADRIPVVAGYVMRRGTEEELGSLHGMVAQELAALLSEEAPERPDDNDPHVLRAWREEMRAWHTRRTDARKDALRFLKDNNITASYSSSSGLQDITARLQDREALERAMHATPS